MKEFEDFIKTGDVKKQGENNSLANALIKSSDKGLKFIKTLEINELSAEHITAEIYDIIRELIEAKLALEGYKSYSHEATILFLKKFNKINESEINFLDNLRRLRNGIKYYGKEATKEDALKTLEFMNALLPKLKKLIKNDK